MKSLFDVIGMSCASCQTHVQKAVEKLDGVKSVNVNLINNNMVVVFDEAITNKDLIINAVRKAGYDAKEHITKTQSKKKFDIELIKLIVSLIILLFIMYFSMGNMMFNFPAPSFIAFESNPFGFALNQLILLIPIVVIYFRYFISGYSKLFKGHPNMDTLIAIGSTASIIYGIYCVFMIGFNHNEYAQYLYFESAAMILTLVSLGKYIEKLSKKKTTSAIEDLINLAPQVALIYKDNVIIEVPAISVKEGDIVIVKKGMSIPVDGIVVSGTASVEEANITGESMPVYKESGMNVYSSTILVNGYIEVKATKVGENTSIANIIKLVEEASNSKAPISRLADKISGIFVPIILGIAILTFIINFFVGSKDFELALNFAITVVVIACPCALGLATPVAIMVGTGKGAQNGLLIKDAEILERAHHIKTIVLDKTGTITEGKPKVVDYLSFDNDSNLKSLILSIETKSEHPLANAICDYFKNESLIDVSDFNSIEGRGVKSNIDGNTIYIGNRRLVDELNLDNVSLINECEKRANKGETPIYVLKNNVISAAIFVKDKVKKNSAFAVKKLKEAGIEVIMITGDNKLTANSVAKEVGIDKVYAEVLPSEKEALLKTFKKNDKHLVAMVGDGVNDAIALTSADIGIALGGGSDVAIDSANIVLIRNDLADVNNVIKLSKRTLITIKICLFWAFFYNFICVIFATGFMYYINGFKMNPMVGSIAMSISSVSVVLTALTINLFKPIHVTEEIVMNSDEKTLTISVNGMMCPHCVKHVQDACLKVDGVISANASLESNSVTVTYIKTIEKQEIINNIIEAGYEAK